MAKVLSLAEKRVRSLPQERETWIATVRRAPVWIRPEDGVPQRPWAVLVMAPTTMQIRSMEFVGEPPDPETLLTHILNAMARPMTGARGKYRPDAVALEDRELATFLKPRLKTLGIRTSCPGHLPVIDDLLLNLDASMNRQAPLPGLLAAENVTEAAMGAFFIAAEQFFRAAPWQALHDANVLEVRCPAEAPPWYATVLGAGGEVFGLALYPSLADLERLWESAGGPEAAELLRSVAVWFSAEDEVPFADLDAMEGKDWPLAGPDAYPVAVRVDPDEGQDRPDGEQLTLLTAALEAVARFSEEFCDVNPYPDPIVVPVRDGREAAVELVPQDEHGFLPTVPEHHQLEAFIDGWHWDDVSHTFAQEAGGFLLSFLLLHLAPMDLSEATWRRHEGNTWHMGRFATHSAADAQPFTPAVFAGEPKFLREFRSSVSRSKTRLKQYGVTWNHLQRYLGSLRTTSLF